MIRIRKITDIVAAKNQQAIDQVKEILRNQIPELGEGRIDQFVDQLRDPLKYQFQTMMLVSDDSRGQIKGFALLMIDAHLKFFYLDFIATLPGRTSMGIGGALYQNIREEVVARGFTELYFECLPDDPELCRDQNKLPDNKRRLAFYEKFGARPIINTKYEMPVNPGEDCPPYLVLDLPASADPPDARRLRKIMRAILERKYGDYCTPEYVDEVIRSVKDPVTLRPLRYYQKPVIPPLFGGLNMKRKIGIVINDKHSIHHVREIGYVESPVRIPAIMKELNKTDVFHEIPPRDFPIRWIESIHDQGYIRYFKTICQGLKEGRSIYPYVFPIRNVTRPPKDLSVRAGYYCIDTFTPLNNNAYIAARRAVDCTLTAAESILKGSRSAYSLVRPPGHHAERYVFGGFCYFNNNAIAANYLSEYGKVAILDVDYHHGNGQQQIFYDRADVFTVSIHGHPSFAYPYFTGFDEETGVGPGINHNLNIPLKKEISGIEYQKSLKRALDRIRKFSPAYLVVAVGFDTAKGDPTGTWKLGYKDFEQNGRMIAGLNLPTLFVQEGGYYTRSIGVVARHFFTGFIKEHLMNSLTRNR
ncbi:MAG: histone deacetylase family protein [Cyclobacteriaceae bacterium]|nr:histone deacetylase family protein [Cyclobacteriaceae bacterium]